MLLVSVRVDPVMERYKSCAIALGQKVVYIIRRRSRLFSLRKDPVFLCKSNGFVLYSV